MRCQIEVTQKLKVNFPTGKHSTVSKTCGFVNGVVNRPMYDAITPLWREDSNGFGGNKAYSSDNTGF